MLSGSGTSGSCAVSDDKCQYRRDKRDDGENSYDYTVFDVVAATLAQDMPDEIETASCVLPQTGFSIYYEDKLLSDINYIYGDTCFFQTFGIPVLKGTPKI